MMTQRIHFGRHRQQALGGEVVEVEYVAERQTALALLVVRRVWAGINLKSRHTLWLPKSKIHGETGRLTADADLDGLKFIDVPEVKNDYLEEFYQQHPEKRPAPRPVRTCRVSSFIIEDFEDIRNLAGDLISMLNQEPHTPLEVRIQEAA